MAFNVFVMDTELAPGFYIFACILMIYLPVDLLV